MKIKYILITILGILLLLISKPTFHLLKTKWKENYLIEDLPKRFVNDASRLNRTQVDSVISINTNPDLAIHQLQQLVKLAHHDNKSISIAGGKYSMGGHTIYPNGIILNMKPFNKIEIDTNQNIMLVGSGATWHEAINELNKYNRSVKVMQAFSSFTIGGSISVNGHGWQKNSPPISSSIRRMKIMKANGQILNCSLTENKELFRLIIGGYGLFGIILEAELEIINNSSLKYNRFTFPSSQYIQHFNTLVLADPKTELVYGRLDITKENFLNTAHLNIFSKTTEKPNSPYQAVPRELKRVIFRGTVNNDYGKKLRNDLEKYSAFFGNASVFSRNELLDESVKLIENRDSLSVDILQEYFIPDRNFVRFISDIKTILPNETLDLLNITIRDVEKDTISYMNYAKEHVFAFVFLFNQPKTNAGEREMKKLTQQLTMIALRNEGTFYLPYRLHNNKDLLHASYPQSIAFFKRKKEYDPNAIFKNMFFDFYK